MSHFPGHQLRERREALGLSLNDLFGRVRIPVAYIKALEEGRVDDLPGVTYGLGFLQSYCAFLDVDFEYFAHRLRLACGGEEPATPQPARAASRAVVAPSRAPWVDDAITWGAVSAIILLAWLSYSVIARPLLEEGGAPAEAASEVAEPPIPHFEESY